MDASVEETVSQVRLVFALRLYHSHFPNFHITVQGGTDFFFGTFCYNFCELGHENKIKPRVLEILTISCQTLSVVHKNSTLKQTRRHRTFAGKDPYPSGNWFVWFVIKGYAKSWRTLPKSSDMCAVTCLPGYRTPTRAPFGMILLGQVDDSVCLTCIVYEYVSYWCTNRRLHVCDLCTCPPASEKYIAIHMIQHVKFLTQHITVMMIAFITIKSSLVPLIEGLCRAQIYFRFEISVVCSHLLFFFFAEEKTC